jgi:glyoxylase-like metal-dependent hydrolase (beta-lactamase superfamily II)
VATVWPTIATEEQIKNRSVPRVEIFKMPGGTEYIIHDVNANNVIIGKARISGHIKVSESMSVDGFGGHSMLSDDTKDSTAESQLPFDSESSRYIDDMIKLPTFHPPSFGVTVLGNSHGFDKSGSVSGYVLWINGRGVMIDPPPYSSATLEREGIRPRTIVGIILTHCHADHDAGAFQKVLTGSPVVVITTPTIYKSFIRKYAALSALSPALLRHSHRFKPAIIGEPLRFQGATFQFTYTLHTIPCVGFRVEWRGRSMVFTGDHFNSPPDMEKLEKSGVLSKARADDLRNLPLQDCDLLLHEAGAPPIHTPLDVLLKLPEKVKKRLFVVHTSALPPNCELKVAPTGTKGTIRLDKSSAGLDVSNHSLTNIGFNQSNNSINDAQYDNNWSFRNEYESPRLERIRPVGFHLQSSLASHEPLMSGAMKGRTSMFPTGSKYEAPPLVALRPASSTDAWFILNLLSAVPFLSRFVLHRVNRLCVSISVVLTIKALPFSIACHIRQQWNYLKLLE